MFVHSILNPCPYQLSWSIELLIWIKPIGQFCALLDSPDVPHGRIEANTRAPISVDRGCWIYAVSIREEWHHSELVFGACIGWISHTHQTNDHMGSQLQYAYWWVCHSHFSRGEPDITIIIVILDRSWSWGHFLASRRDPLSTYELSWKEYILWLLVNFSAIHIAR